jgi:hypothetical protein
MGLYENLLRRLEEDKERPFEFLKELARIVSEIRDYENVIEYHTITDGDIEAKKIILGHTVVNPSLTIADIVEGYPLKYELHFEIINNNELSWANKELETHIITGEILRIQYRRTL